MKLIQFFIIIFGLFFPGCGITKSAYVTTKDANDVDTAKFKCAYQFKFLKDSIKMIYGDDLNIIQIGDNFTKSYCYQTFFQDSLWSINKKIHINPTEFRDAISSNNTTYLKEHTYGVFSFYIYKDYRKEKMTVSDQISYHRFTYDDELKPQDWIIMEDTTTILGYSCQKAKCSYRGRDWKAWFAPDIPINEGPWKFYGLPGLIMKLEDTESHYSFEVKDLQRVNEPMYMAVRKSARKIDRISFLKLLMNRTGNNLGAMDLAKVGIAVSGTVKHYDHIERDYK